jgi:hypothetical protein
VFFLLYHRRTQHGYCLGAVRTFVQSRGPDDAPCRTANVSDRHANDGSTERTPVPRRRRARGAPPLCTSVVDPAHHDARRGDPVVKAVQGQSRCHAKLDPVRAERKKKRPKLADSLDRVSKGDSVAVPIRLLNRSTEIWGEDANEFRCAALSCPFCCETRSLINWSRVLGRSGGKMYQKPCMRFRACMAT